MEPPFSPRALGITTPLLKIELVNEAPHLYPVVFVVVERYSVLVGDEFGMRVASYPYADFRPLRPSQSAWRFFADDCTGDYTLSPALPDVDYPADAEVPT